MAKDTAWHPACPSCGRPIPAAEAVASRRREAVSTLQGVQVTCSACGTTVKVDRRTELLKA